VRLLVQHSEGFAGENLSSRESAVEPRNADDTLRSQYDFTLAVESDTQYYNEEFHQHQTAIHDYLLAERSDLNLQYLFHTGDIVDDYDQLWQWDYADPEYQKLDDAGLPYGVLAGNHDVGHKEVDYTNYGTYFGADRYQENPWWGGDYKNNRGHYDLITAGGIDFLMLYMGWGPGDDEIAWMNEVLAQYPERIVVLNLHEYMLTTGGLGPIPQQIYDEVIATNPNVRMVFSGHYHDAYTRIDGFDDDGDGTDDRQVYQILFDYQGLAEGGLGYLRLLHFDNENQQIIARTYSPSLDDYDADDPSLDPEHQEFTMPYAALGIQPAQKVLRTDGVRVDILTSHEIGAVSDVESGATTSVTWDAAPGEYGWYASSVDPFGAAADSEVRTLTVLAASGPGGGDNPGGGGSGDGDGSGSGDSDGRPTENTVPVSVADLDPSLEGAIAPSGTLRVGDPITISVPGHDGEWVQVWLHSTPTLISGWTKVAGGTVTATVPASVPAGTHTLVVQNSSGVIGWATVTVEGAAGQAVISDGVMAQTGADGLPLGIAGALALVAILVGAGILVRRRIAS
ncbi:MAG TPA: cell wall protein, partial [Microbacterium sp.]|nr:cell wall protein [Microbacterium sp.]